jgi:hypothetical protein
MATSRNRGNSVGYAVRTMNDPANIILIVDENSASGCPSKDAVNTSMLALCQLHAGKAFTEHPEASSGTAEI